MLRFPIKKAQQREKPKKNVRAGENPIIFMRGLPERALFLGVLGHFVYIYRSRSKIRRLFRAMVIYQKIYTIMGQDMS